MMEPQFIEWLGGRNLDEQGFHKLKPEQRLTLAREFEKPVRDPDEQFKREMTLRYGSLEAAMENAPAVDRVNVARILGRTKPAASAPIPPLPEHLDRYSATRRQVLWGHWQAHHEAGQKIAELKKVPPATENLRAHVSNEIARLRGLRDNIRFNNPDLRLKADEHDAD